MIIKGLKLNLPLMPMGACQLTLVDVNTKQLPAKARLRMLTENGAIPGTCKAEVIVEPLSDGRSNITIANLVIPNEEKDVLVSVLDCEMDFVVFPFLELERKPQAA